MYKHILIGVAPDHHAPDDGALAVARKLLAKGGKITALTVMETIPAYVAQYLPEGQFEKNRREIEATLHADLGGVKDVDSKVVMGHSGQTILEYAEKEGVDCIVIASHRPGLSDYFLGSTAARVVRHASCAVHVLR